MSEALDMKGLYKAANGRKALFILLFVILAAVSATLSVGFGVYNISVTDSISVLLSHIADNVADPVGDHYVWDVRLPRALGGIFAGAGLAVGGAVMQNNMRNPLAEPYTMGISSGAFLGAVLSLILGISIVPSLYGTYATVGNAFLFSLIPMAIIMVASKLRKMTPTTMILLGIAVMYLFSSITQVIMVTSPSESLADAYGWRVGNLSKVNWDNLPFIAASTTAFGVSLYIMRNRLDLLYIGDRGAQTLGEDVNRLRVLSLMLVSFMTATIVSFTGTIGFISLVGPHVARMFVGANNRYLIPASAAFGAAFIALADIVAKMAGANGVPVGVISSMIGGPLFMYLLIKYRRKVWM